MRLVYLTHQYFPRHVGGTEVYTRDLARRAISEGHDVLVVSCHESATTSKEQVVAVHTSYEGIRIIELHFNLSLMGDVARAEYDNGQIYAILKKELSVYRANLAHITHAMKLSCAALDVCHDLQIPAVVTLSDFWFICPETNLVTWDGKNCSGPGLLTNCLQCVADLHNINANLRNAATVWQRKERLKKSLLRANRIIALTQFQKDIFVRNGYPSGRIEVIEHGIELDSSMCTGKRSFDCLDDTVKPAMDDSIVDVPVDSAPLKQSNDAGVGTIRKIVFIGSIVKHKGAHILVEALGMLPDLPIECHIYGACGDGDAYGQMLKNAASRDKRIFFRGTFHPSQLAAVISQYDVLALPALWHENGPLVVKAALKLGIPALVSDIGCLPNMVKHGVNGWLVQPGSPEAWAEGIRQVASLLPLTFEPPRIKTFDQNAVELFDVYRDVIQQCK